MVSSSGGNQVLPDVNMCHRSSSPAELVAHLFNTDDGDDTSHRSDDLNALHIDTSSELSASPATSDIDLGVGEPPGADDNFIIQLNKPIYPGARHTYGNCACALHEIRSRGHLTRRAMQLLLNCLKELLPPDAVFPSSVYKLNKVLAGRVPVATTSYCLECSAKVDVGSTVCSACESSLVDNTGRFHAIDPIEQLKCAMEHEGLLNHVTFPADQPAIETLQYYNATVYKRFLARIDKSARSDLTCTIL